MSSFRAWKTPYYICAAAAGYTLVAGVISMLGWITGLYRLTDWWNTGISIKANTSIAAVSASIALFGILHSRKSTRRISGWLGVFTLTIGFLTLIEHVTNLDFGIDTFLFDEAPGARATSAPGRMGPPAALSFLALGVAIYLSARHPSRYRISIGLGIIVMGIAILSLVGYWYGAPAMYTIPQLTGIAVTTATMLLALSIAVIALHPEHEPMRTLREDSSGGILARRLMAAAFAVPLGLGWLRIWGMHAGLYDDIFGTALRTIVEIVILVGLLWWSVQAIRVRELRQAQAETARRAAVASLREADRRKDEFLATLAHELRNPLAPIRTAAALLIAGDVSAQSLQSCAGIIDRQVRHMARLLDDLLDISRISRNRLELRKAPVELKRIVESAVETSRPEIEKGDHELHIELPPEAIVLDADAARLAQVFSNLLNNAAQFTERGGRITVTAERDADAAAIHVTDTGVGIERQSLPHIFDMFTQVAPAAPVSQSGLGIGLALAREIVKLHGGEIEAFSAGANTGSRLSVRLPCLRQSPAPLEPAAEAPPAVNKRRLLVVDDLKDNADTLAVLLKHFGNEVQVAYGGEAALAAAESFRPDAMLLDIGLPDLDGVQVCEAIRLQPWGKDIFIVALTGWGNPADFQRTEAAGFNAHLVKPVELAQLLQVLSGIDTSSAA